MTDLPNIRCAEFDIGPFIRADETVPDAPHRAPWDGDWPSLGVIWEDATHEVPLAVTDHDGCRAVVLRRVAP